MKNSVCKLMLASGMMAMVFLPACKQSYLERQAIGSTSENILATKAGADALLIGAYSLLNNGGTVGGGWPSGKWIFGGVASDDAHTGTEAGALQPVPAFESYTADATLYPLNDKWRFFYSAIQRSNDVLRILPKIPKNAITDEQALQIKAEAVFLRAVYHFEAALMWRNIPYIDESISFANNNYMVGNDGPVWAQLETDFKFAADNLTETKPAPGRANSWAAKAFLVKLYLFQHKFNEAKPLVTDIINKGMTANGKKYDLMANYHDNFVPSKKNGPESVFAVQMSVNDGAGGANGNNSNGEGNAGPYGGPYPSYGFYQPSFSLVNSYKTDPVTGLPLLETFNNSDVKNDQGLASSEPFTPYTGTLDSRLDWTVGRRGIPLLDWGVMPGQAWVRQQSVAGPYVHIKNANPQSEPEARENNSTSVNYCMIRFADVLLWAAEIEVEVGSLDQAEKYVNRVRARAANPAGWVYTYIDNNNPMKGFTNTPAANYKVGLYNGEFTQKGKSFARESVRFERKLELAMENHRFFDLQRYDNGTGYMADVLNAYIKHETTIPGYNFAYMVGAKFTKGKNELYPIPQAQIDLSVVNGKPLLKQNPNY
ncbi:RagB/SusD family nutrient uptake outer membrane protein [Chitinophaga defluvii]|uniref:RagB/SusD family nutrient uptake outer membrane protein n=1 Tax=Chitinophaga defluvii TaxID=3163343 RepID=A0ABV2T0W4_9BACT